MQSNSLLPLEKPFRCSNTEKIGFTLENEGEGRERMKQADVVGVFRLRVQIFPQDHGKDDSGYLHNRILIYKNNHDHGNGGGVERRTLCVWWKVLWGKVRV